MLQREQDMVSRLHARKVMDQLATQTWHSLRECYDLRIRLDEDAITTQLLVAIATRLNATVWIADGRKDEARTGCDFDLWVANTGRGWRRYAIQAKRVSLPTFGYRKIKHQVGVAKELQHDLLRRYAKANRAEPLYCFYNHWDPALWKKGRLLGSGTIPADPKYGCTVATLRTVDTAVHKRGARNYPWIHAQASTMPWSLLLYPQIKGAKGPISDLAKFLGENYYDSLPATLDEPNGPRIRKLLPNFEDGAADGLQARAVVVVHLDLE